MAVSEVEITEMEVHEVGGVTLRQKVGTTSKMKKIDVLDEDTYEKNLEKIIQRDFFPDLEKLTAQAEYLAAAERNDKEKMRELMVKYRRKTGLSTPSVSSTPSTFETPTEPFPKSTPARDNLTAPDDPNNASDETDEQADTDAKSKIKLEASDLPLDQYLSNYTSEDTESFEKLMQEAERRRQVKYSWLFEQEKEHEDKYHEQLALPSCEVQAITDTNSKTGRVDNWTYKARNAVMYYPEAMELTVGEKLEVVKKEERAIVHENTRFIGKPFDDLNKQQAMNQAAATQAAANQGRVGVDGKVLIPVDTPKVAGFSFVATPSPAPGLIDESPLMTWGEIEGTPFRLDAPDTPRITSSSTPHFKIPHVPKRDSLALSLVEKASAQHRKKKEEALRQASATFSCPSPSFGSQKSMERLRNMSPAAQRLASNKLGVRVGTDKALRESYTPSPCRSPHSPRTPANIISSYRSSTRSMRSDRSQQADVTSAHGATSATTNRLGARSSRRSRTPASTESSLTDNLLHIPSATPTGSSEKKRRLS